MHIFFKFQSNRNKSFQLKYRVFWNVLLRFYWLSCHIKMLFIRMTKFKAFPAVVCVTSHRKCRWHESSRNPMPCLVLFIGAVFICGSCLGLKLILYVCLAWVALPPADIAATLSVILSFPIMTNFHNSNGHNNPFYIEYKNPITFDASLWRQIKMVGVARSGSLCVTLHYCLSCSSCSSFIVVCLSVSLSVCHSLCPFVCFAL